MDYCQPCRRHLNGALACPGCGAPAEACREYAQTVAVSPQQPGDGLPPGDDAYDGPAPRTRGRRKERSRRAHRRRRRKVLFVTAGLALAAGGLSLAELGTESRSEDPAAASVRDAGTAGPSPSRSGEAAGGAPGAATAEDAVATSAPASGAARDAGRRAERERADGRETKGGAERRDDAHGGGGDPRPAATPTAARPPAGGGPATARPTPPAATAEPRPTRPPAPEPTRTCDRFLWWCT
ncbi:hypothetical protein [Streptomyces sp. NPDC002564]|uniref:SCO2400 family protein n=1 Tax=Streptomyces sp. NPDC002564 TaxID=3364649 RepID=UPI00367553D5